MTSSEEEISWNSPEGNRRPTLPCNPMKSVPSAVSSRQRTVGDSEAEPEADWGVKRVPSKKP